MPTADAGVSFRNQSMRGARHSPARALARGRYAFAIPPFLLGMLAAQSVNVGGQLYLGEVLGVLLALTLIRSGRLSQTERRLVLFAVFWSCAQALSDVYNQTAVSDSLKGVFAPLVFMAAVVGLSAYFRAEPLRMPSFLLGVTLGAIVSLAAFPTANFSSNAWKFGVGGTVLALFAIYYSFFLRRQSLVLLYAALIAFLVASLYYDSRSVPVLAFLAGMAYSFARLRKGARGSKYFSGQWGLMRLLLLFVAVALLLNAGVTALFLSSSFLSRISPAAAQKYEAQASGRFGVLLGGRSDVLISAKAFLDKPLLGHGSWPKDTSGYRVAYLQARRELGYSFADNEVMSSPWIPTHSYLMGALVWSGVMGGLFWLVLLYLVLRRFLRTAGQLPFYFYLGMADLAWSALFSPFGASSRWAVAVFLAAFLVYTRVSDASRVDC